MRRISSQMTYFHKRIFPVIWFGILGVAAVVTGYLTMIERSGPPFPFLILPVFMGIFGYFIFKKIIFDLVDEVYDDGDFIVVKNNNKEIRIPLTNIRNISYSTMVNPQRITLSLRERTPFGQEVTFSPPIRVFGFWQKDALVDDLINRVDQARQR